MVLEGDIRIHKRAFAAAVGNGAKAAYAVKLQYVSASEEGILRKRWGKKFRYQYGNTQITDRELLERIRKLVIPPAWENVWICRYENGHLQVTGTDALGRKQYRYHPLWNQVRNHTKFYRMVAFGHQLPQIRAQVEKDLARPGFPKEKVLALIVCLLEQTHIRIGSSLYEKLYGSFGLTTLKNKHVKVEGPQITFSFKGKKGVKHEIGIRSRRLARMVQSCRDIPGKELFGYVDESGGVHKVDSGMVNQYLRTVSGGDFTAKDFRTWAGSTLALAGFTQVGGFESQADMNRKVILVYDQVANALGNTRTVCKKHYIHPTVVKMYVENRLEAFVAQFQENPATLAGLSDEERMLLHLLEKGN